MGPGSRYKCSKNFSSPGHVLVTNFSAAVTSDGELYTWGRGNYGRLGHGSSEDALLPTLVDGLRGHIVLSVSCGSGDAQTLALTSTGDIFSWGDGDYGKLGKKIPIFFSLERIA